MNSRRNFLRIAGAGITGSLLKPVGASAGKLSVGRNSVKVGVLLPQSNEHPMYPGSFLNGIRLGLNQRNALKKNKIEVISENVNYGSPMVSKSKLQQLITENNVNLVVGLLNTEVAYDISDLVKNAEIPTVIANAGENYLVNSVKENPYLFFNTLNLLENSYQAGRYAVEKFGKNIGVVTAFYDSGYDALFAFYKGVETAGGTIVNTHLKKQKDDGFISRTLDSLETENPDGIYVFLNGNMADDFFRSLHQRKLEIPLLTTSFATEEKRLQNLGEAGSQIESFGSWTKNINNRENQVFVSAYQKQYAKDPDQFSFLGYETGLLIYHSLTQCGGDFAGLNLADSLSACKISSPGGKIAVNRKSGMVNNPIYLSQTQTGLMGLPQNKVVDVYQPISEFDKTFAALDNEMHSGWLNPYLFV